MLLVERDGALGRLDALLTAAAQRGTVALVSGEAGIGKSVLAAEFAARAARRARVLWGACDPLDTPRALGPVHDIGRQAGGDLAATLGSSEGREAVFAALLAELESQRSTTVVVIEDAHWADEATLDMLMFLGRRLVRLHALLVVTFRDDELGPDHPLPAVLSTLPREIVNRIELEPLSAPAVAQLAAGAGRDAADVFATTGGNPLLVAEVLAAADTGVPATVRDLMQARLAALPEAARDLARLVAVVPGHVDGVLLTGAADAVEACVAGGVLVASGTGMAFRHELLRRAVQDEISSARSAELHATVLAALDAAGADPARLAHHALQAADVPALLRHAPEAARRAAAMNAHREATGHLRAVLPHVDRLPERERAELLQTFVAQAFAAGDAADGLAVAFEALALWEELGERERAAVTQLWIARLSWWTGQLPDGRVAFEKALAMLEALPPTPDLALAYALRAQALDVADDPDGAIEWGRRAVDMAEQVGDVRTAMDARSTIAFSRLLHHGGNPDELEQLHRMALAERLPAVATRALVGLAWTAVEQGDYRTGAVQVQRALDTAQAHDVDRYLPYLLGERARVDLQQGRWDRIRDDVEHAVAWPGPAGGARVPALVALGLLQARTGEPEAIALLDRAAGFAYATDELTWIVGAATARSEYFWLQGDRERAVAEARRFLPMAVERNHPWFAGALAFQIWRAGAVDDLPAAIDQPHRLLLDGDWAGAAGEWERRGAFYSRAEALICGDADAAAEALRFVDGLGATAVAQRWRAELRARGLRVPRGPHRSTRSNPAGLTPRQLDVLALLAEGLTNPQIAERLSMSVKTVGHHVAAVLDKLDATSRGKATATAMRLGLIRSN